MAARTGAARGPRSASASWPASPLLEFGWRLATGIREDLLAGRPGPSLSEPQRLAQAHRVLDGHGHLQTVAAGRTGVPLHGAQLVAVLEPRGKDAEEVGCHRGCFND